MAWAAGNAWQAGLIANAMYDKAVIAYQGSDTVTECAGMPLPACNGRDRGREKLR